MVTAMCATLMVVLAFGLVLYGVRIGRGQPGASWVSKLLFLNCTVTLPLSGLVHMAQLPGVSRGYVDLMEDPESGPLFYATVLTLLAGASLVIGNSFARRCSPQSGARSTVASEYLAPRRREIYILLMAVAVLAPISVAANMRLQTQAIVDPATRFISVKHGGAADYYVATWLPWCISFGCILLLARRTWMRSPWVVCVLVAVAFVTDVACLQWTGGRTLALVLATPLVAVTAPLMGRSLWLFLGGLSVAGAIYLRSVTLGRTHGRTDLLSVWSWIDWQWGRFSMLGWAHEYVSVHGLLSGETLLRSISSSIQAVAGLMGISVGNAGLQSSSQVVANGLANDPSATYIVPGMAGEFFLNFGISGVLLGFMFIGYCAGVVDRKIRGSRSLVVQLLWAYLGSVLVWRTITSTSDAFVAYLIFSGTPILAVVAIASLSRTLSSGAPDARAKVPARTTF